MSDSSSLKEQYARLRKKIDVRVQELQGRLIDQNKTTLSSSTHCPIHGNRPQLRPNPQQQNYNHYLLNTQRDSNVMQISSRMTEQQNQAINNSVAEALRENMKIQKQMSDNLKLLNERILDMSNPSSGYQQQQNNFNTFKKIPGTSREHILDNKDTNSYGSHDRPHSLRNYPRSQSNYSLNHKHLTRKNKNKSRQLLFSKDKNRRLFQKSPKFEQQNYEQEYFGAKNTRNERCPIEQAKKMKIKASKKKKCGEIYQDAQHRNKKHEKDHLLNSYKQQQKSRKQLLNKISKNFNSKSSYKF